MAGYMSPDSILNDFAAERAAGNRSVGGEKRGSSTRRPNASRFLWERRTSRSVWTAAVGRRSQTGTHAHCRNITLAAAVLLNLLKKVRESGVLRQAFPRCRAAS